ncbi:hypothetical protein Syun_024267 [Stephania yunnanensis]|uniref:Uncharacterized protein n=1 Tax=Stephania yunnanensis TaxID=152371 RepID=A0AAP0I420_9MAGN
MLSAFGPDGSSIWACWCRGTSHAHNNVPTSYARVKRMTVEKQQKLKETALKLLSCCETDTDHASLIKYSLKQNISSY